MLHDRFDDFFSIIVHGPSSFFSIILEHTFCSKDEHNDLVPILGLYQKRLLIYAIQLEFCKKCKKRPRCWSTRDVKPPSRWRGRGIWGGLFTWRCLGHPHYTI